MYQFSITQRASIAVVTLLNCTASLYTAEPNDMILNTDANHYCIKRSLECDPHMRPYMVDVKSSKKHIATLSMFNNLLKVDDPSKCARTIKDESLTALRTMKKNDLEQFKLHMYRSGNMMVCIDALIKTMSGLFLHHCVVESNAIAERIVNAAMSFDPSKISTRSLQIYYTNQTIFQRLEQGDNSISWEDFFDANKEIMLSHDKELLKLMLQPTRSDAPYLAQLKSSSDWRKIIAAYQDTVDVLPETFENDKTIQHSTTFQKLFVDFNDYHKALSKQTQLSDNQDELPAQLKKSLARFMTYHTEYDVLRSVFYQQVVESFDAITSILKSNPELLKSLNFGELCASKQYLVEYFNKREIVPTNDHEMLSQFATVAYFAREALIEIESKIQIVPQPVPSPSAVEQASPTSSSRKSHKALYKRKKKKYGLSTPCSVIDSCKDMGLTGTPATEPKTQIDHKSKVKIASDGSYTRSCDITDHHITIHSIRDDLQVELWKKIHATETPSDKIVYTPYVIDWLTKPKEVISTKRQTVDPDYALGQEQNTIDIHAFPRLVDQYVHSLGSPSTVASRRNDEQVSAYWIPGTMTRNTITTAGLFVYLFNKDNVCFHRMFDKRTNGQIMQDITALNALDQYQIPQN